MFTLSLGFSNSATRRVSVFDHAQVGAALCTTQSNWKMDVHKSKVHWKVSFPAESTAYTESWYLKQTIVVWSNTVLFQNIYRQWNKVHRQSRNKLTEHRCLHQLMSHQACLLPSPNGQSIEAVTSLHILRRCSHCSCMTHLPVITESLEVWNRNTALGIGKPHESCSP